MKKTIYVALAASLLFVSSCGSKQDGAKDDSKQSVEQKDGANEGSDAETVEDGVEASGEVEEYLSPDLRLDDLKGNVAKCLYKKTSCDKDGNVVNDSYWTKYVKVYDVDNFLNVQADETDWRLLNPTLERNEKEQIVKVSWYVEDYDSYIDESYVYNADGTLKSSKFTGIESVDETKFTYENGLLVKSVNDGAGEGSVFRSTTSYKILDTDSNGNWTRRLLTTQFQSGPDDGSGVYTESYVDYEIEVREIKYY